MSRNVEIKARVADAETFARAARGIAGSEAEIILQSDVFFVVPRGRLKLRRLPRDRAELIWYERSDAAGPETSSYRLVPVDDPDGLEAALSDALGVRGTVRKTRRLFRAGRTRIHLDAVDGLGDFMELEVVLAEGEDAAAGETEARELMDALGIVEADLVETAYVDLLGG